MISESIQDLLAKKVTGEASSDELAQLQSWSLESDENRRVYDQYESLWSAAAKYEPIDFEVDTEAAYQKHIQLLDDSSSEEEIQISDKVSKPRVISMIWVRSLAAMLVLALGAVWLMTPSSTSFEAGDKIRYVSLSDGTSIWLDEGSTLEHKDGFGKEHRNVTLSGKAFFDVNRNEQLPFAIDGRDIDVSVLGTSFTVDAINNIVEVATGLVSVESESAKVKLSKGQSASLQENILVEGAVGAEAAKWRNSDLSFNSASLEQVVSDVNLFHNDKIELAGVKSLDCLFTSGSLKGESLNDIILIIEKNYDLTREINPDGKIVLTINDCL